MILQELAHFEEQGHDDQRLRRAAAELLDRQFITPGDRGLARHYYTLIDNKYWSYFQGLFDALGRRLIKNEREQWVGVLPQTDLYPDVASALPRMRQSETILLLVIALVYQEKVNQGDVERGAVVRTDTGELFDRYTTLLGRERMRDSEFRELVSEPRRRGIIAFGERDEESLDFEVIVRPIIKFVVSDDVRSALRQFLGDQERALDAEGVPAADQDADDDAAATTDDAESAGDREDAPEEAAETSGQDSEASA